MKILFAVIVAFIGMALIASQQSDNKSSLTSRLSAEWLSSGEGLPRTIREGRLTRRYYLGWLINFKRESHPLRWIHDEMQDARRGWALLSSWDYGEDEEAAREGARDWLKQTGFGEDLKWLYEDNFWSFMLTPESRKYSDLCRQILHIQRVYNRDEFYSKDHLEKETRRSLEYARDHIAIWRQRASQAGLNPVYLDQWANEHVIGQIEYINGIGQMVFNMEMARGMIEQAFGTLGVTTTQWPSHACY